MNVVSLFEIVAYLGLLTLLLLAFPDVVKAPWDARLLFVAGVFFGVYLIDLYKDLFIELLQRNDEQTNQVKQHSAHHNQAN